MKLLMIISVAACTTAAVAQTVGRANEIAPSSSLLVTTPIAPPLDALDEPHALRDVSLFAVAPPQPRRFQLHDLVQIIVRETSTAKSTHDLETKKDTEIDGRVNAWPHLSLQDLLDLQLRAGSGADLPAANVEFTKDFKGEGDYQRKDDLSARITAEVIEVLPNGNLILEARSHIKTDDEEQTMKVTGICRPEDVTAVNTVLSNQIHDLRIEKMHKGELKKTGSKGIITKVLETVFAF